MRTVEIEYLFSAALIRVISYLVSFVIYPFLIFSTFYPFLFYKLRTKEEINKEEKKFYPKSSLSFPDLARRFFFL